ncbi:ankyrin-3-like [Trichogramma pretiosum]|uniref:ankyrin-3-like n=1 Tax=Trichogramma pretiosum TaxID=7493 RepID=UPI000C71AA48|nr:ankyrin-3-like [Trichogramma pretiosum]
MPSSKKSISKEALEYNYGMNNLLRLKNLQESVKWEIEEKRHKFLHEFYALIQELRGPIPYLQYIFKKEEIDLFLVDALKLDGSEIQADKIIEFLIKTEYKDKPDVEKYSRKKLLHRNTPLHYLAKNEFKGRNNVIKDLFTIYDCFDVNYYDDSGLTHFHAACKFGCVDVVEKFIELGQDPNCYECESEEKYPRSPLHLALEYGSIRVAALLLRSGADPNSVGEDGCTPLHVICQNGELLSQAREMERLFKCSNERYARVKVDARDNLGRTPMHYAVAQTEVGSLSFGRDNPIGVLMEHGADPMAADAEGLTPMHIICQKDVDDSYADTFCDMLPSTALKETCVEALDKSGNRPLHYALRGGLRRTYAALLRRGADANRANEYGQTPAHMICGRKEDDGLMGEFVAMNDIKASLMRPVSLAPLEVDSRDRWGQTPLHLAAANGLKTATKVLLKNGADSNATDSNGSTPLHLICTSKHNDDLAKIFFAINDEKQQPIKVNARDNSGNTPLHLALRYADRVLAEMLLRRGADPNLINHKGSTPLHFMCAREDDNDWLARVFFRACGDMEKTVKIDARDNRVIKDEFIDFSDEFKMILASCPLNILGHLKKRGYELDQSGALVVVKFFTRYRLFKMSSDVTKCSRCAAKQAKEAGTSDSESEEFENVCIAAKSPGEACVVHKVEKQTRKFFLEWALEFFMELTRDRVPYLCSSQIMEQLRNRDLCNVCLAGEIQDL